VDDGIRSLPIPPAAAKPKRSLLAAGVVATSCGFAMVARGASETVPVFLLPLEAAFDVGREPLTGVFALAMLASGLIGPMAGTIFDRLGPRWLYGFGAAMLVVAFLGASSANQLWHLRLTLGVCLGLGIACLSTAAQAPLLGRWFQGRIGTMIGLVSGAGGLGALLFAPLSQTLIDGVGWREAYLWLAFLVGLLIVPLAFLPWSRMSAGAADLQGVSRGVASWDSRRILRDPAFLGIFASYTLTCIGMFTVQVLIVGYFVDVGYTPLLAATTLGLSGFAASLGMVLFGWLSDRIGYLGTLTTTVAVTAVGLMVLAAMMWAPSPWLLALHVVTFGLSFGARAPLILGLAARRFAGPHLGRVTGSLVLGFGFGSALGAWLGGALHDLTGGYAAGLTTTALCLAAALLPWWAIPSLRRAAR
jgi:MFS family permease